MKSKEKAWGKLFVLLVDIGGVVDWSMDDSNPGVEVLLTECGYGLLSSWPRFKIRLEIYSRILTTL
jgi:hypothetical protein